MEWDRELTLEFIERYKAYRVLWDPKNRNYFNKFRKQDAWGELGKKMNRPVGVLKKKMETLLAGLRREKMKMTKSLGTGKGPDEIYKSNWFAFESLQFLMDKNKPRQTLSSQQTEASQQNESQLDEIQESSSEMPSPNSEFQSDLTKISSQRPHSEIKCAPKKHSKNYDPAPSNKKKKAKPTDDERQAAFDILKQSASTAQIQDECYHFGHFVSAKLRQYDRETRSSIQSAIMEAFARAPIYNTSSNHFPHSSTSAGPLINNPHSNGVLYYGYPGQRSAVNSNYVNSCTSSRSSSSPSPTRRGSQLTQLDTLHNHRYSKTATTPTEFFNEPLNPSNLRDGGSSESVEQIVDSLSPSLKKEG